MQSFSKTSKLELLNQEGGASIPFFFGLFLSAGSYDEVGDVEIATDLKEIFPFLKKSLNKVIKQYSLSILEGETINLIDGFKINNKLFYKIIFPKAILEVLYNQIGITTYQSLQENFLLSTKTALDVKNFVKGIYLGCATSSIKISERPNEKTSSGYHLEFASKSLPFLRELSHILAQFDIFPKLISRKKNYVLYLKDAEQVCNLLALIGANNSVLVLQNEIAKRDFRNKINRQTNCLSGNISKTVDASIKQLEAIKKIDQKIGLNNLPPDLEEVALMRIANPEEPLNVLLQLSNIQLTKSGLNHRFRKIISIAEKL